MYIKHFKLIKDIVGYMINFLTPFTIKYTRKSVLYVQIKVNTHHNFIIFNHNYLKLDT